MAKDVDPELLEDELEEDVIEGDEEEEIVEDSDDEDDDDIDPEEDDKPSKGKGKKTTDGVPKFTKEQQALVDKLVQSRLERAEKQFIQRFIGAAGVDVDRHELPQAAGLWGFLKVNPQLSDDVQKMIDAYIAKGNYVEPKTSASASREGALGRREAILDLKASDVYFAKHSKEILEWAEDEDFDIVDAKTLKRAYLAYKGARGALDRADREHRRKQQAGTSRKDGKVAMSSKSGAPKKATNYAKMSDADILAASGLKLFTDD